jgi:hypothetical protein
MQQESESRQRSYIQILSGVVVLVAVLVLGSGPGHGVSPDAESYIAIAQGHLSQAAAPFSSRFLHGMLVYTVSRPGLSTEISAALVAICALLVFISAATLLLRRNSKPAWLLFTPALLLLPWLIQFFKLYYHPELFHAVLVALFFLALPRHPRWALVLLFLQVLTRESTILLSFSLVLVAVIRRNWRFAAEAACVSLLAFGTVSLVTSFAQPNIHGITGPLYIFAKVFHQFCYNCLGLLLIVDKHAYYRDFTPTYVFDLPHWRILGGITKLAFIKYDQTAQLNTVYAYLTTFGIIPMLFLAYRRGMVAATKNAPPVIQISLIYAILCFVTAPLLGNTIARYLAYGWPAVLIAAPALLGPLLPARGAARAWLLGIHIWLCWGELIWNQVWPANSVWSLACLTVVALTLNYFGFRIIRDNRASQSDRMQRVQAAVQSG